MSYVAGWMGGNEVARHNLGAEEADKGNMRRAVKHFMIVAGAWFQGSLGAVRDCCEDGYATKDEYASAQHAYKKYQDDTKSEQREKFLLLSVRMDRFNVILWNGKFVSAN